MNQIAQHEHHLIILKVNTILFFFVNRSIVIRALPFFAVLVKGVRERHRSAMAKRSRAQHFLSYVYDPQKNHKAEGLVGAYIVSYSICRHAPRARCSDGERCSFSRLRISWPFVK